MIFTTENLISITAIVVGTSIGVVSLVISYYLNKKTLKQSEKNLKIKLLHEDRKKALFTLSERFKKSKNYPELKKNIFEFIKSSEGQYLPDDIIKMIYTKINEIEEFIDKKCPYKPPEPSQEEVEEWEIMDWEQKTNMTPFEKFELEFEEKLSSFKNEIEAKAHRKLKTPTE